MKSHALAAVTGIVLAGCGGKAEDMKNALNAVEAASKAASAIAANTNDAEKFYADRKARGDTIAMPYADLQKFLPSAPDGYAAAGEPEGSSQSMSGFSMSQAEQTFHQPAGADGNAPSVKVTILDLGGTEGAYGIMALPMMMDLSQEDAHHRMKTHKMDAAYSWASEEFNKDSKEAKVTIVTRYRFMVTVEAENQTSDQSAMAMRLAEEIARKFEGK